MKLKNVLIFIATFGLIGVFGYLSAEQGDYTTMGYNTPGGYSWWRVASTGALVPGVASTLNIGSALLPVNAIYSGSLVGSTLTSSTLTSPIITGPAISGTSAFTGPITVVSDSGVSVSTSATAAASLRLRGAVVTLSTMSFTYGDVFIQTSDNKVYVATRTVVPADNTPSCAGTVCYSAFN